jgi:hypothetical protein
VISMDLLWEHLQRYLVRTWSFPSLRYATVVMILGYLGIMAIEYLREKNQLYTLNFLPHFIAWSSLASFLIIFGFHGLNFFVGLNLVPLNGYGQILQPIIMAVFSSVAFVIYRLGHNVICWYLGTPLWPWNPFVNKPGFEKIVAENQRDNKKRWLAEQRRKRLEGKRYSD